MIVEFYRAHDESNPLALSLSLEQWISLVLTAFGIYLFFGRKPLFA